MTLEQQVCSLPLAQRLKELGVKQESLFGWNLEHQRITSSGAVEEWIGEERASAFTVAELGEMLPTHVRMKVGKNLVALNFKHTYPERWDIVLHGVKTITGPTEADARAKMLIYLLENDLLNPSLTRD